MYQSLLATTSTEGLQPLGTPAQRSFELVSGAVRARLSEDHAALFAEPVAAQHGEAIDWHAPREGRGVALADLGEADRTALRGRLDQIVQDIRAEAQTLADSPSPSDQRLAEALLNALEIPGEDMIRAIRAPDGSLHPVLLHWSWLRDEQRAVRGVLSTMVARPAPPTQTEAAPQRSKAPLWWLLILGWLLLALMLASAEGRLAECPAPAWRDEAALCVVMAAKGYPGAYQRGEIIRGVERAGDTPGVTVFQAGTALKDQKLVSAGGRVLGVTALGDTIAAARASAYAAIDSIDWPGGFCRRDIGWRALNRQATS